MDTQQRDQRPSLNDLEHKADEFISLIFSTCEARIQKSRAKPSVELTALTHSAITLQKNLETFLALLRIHQ